jgi:hypothetical protein
MEHIPTKRRKTLKLYQVNYFTEGPEAVSFAVAKNEEQAWKMVSGGRDFELISIKECDLTTINIIHTEIIEVI